MKRDLAFKLGIALCAMGAMGLLLWLGLDSAFDQKVSNIFYRHNGGFYLAGFWGFHAAHWLATIGARLLGGGLALGVVITLMRNGPFLKFERKDWLFLFLALLLIPGLVVNVGLKDHWGRARPRETIAYGGISVLSPALKPQASERANGSFVAGDPAFGFFLTAFAYVVPWRQSRRVFWSGVAAGGICGLARIAMGAHFFSDVLFAAFIVMGFTALLHSLFFNIRLTLKRWHLWFFISELNPSLK